MSPDRTQENRDPLVMNKPAGGEGISIGQYAYEAYREAVGERTHDGKMLPPWEESEPFHRAWDRATEHACILSEELPKAHALGVLLPAYYDAYCREQNGKAANGGMIPCMAALREAAQEGWSKALEVGLDRYHNIRLALGGDFLVKHAR